MQDGRGVRLAAARVAELRSGLAAASRALYARRVAVQAVEARVEDPVMFEIGSADRSAVRLTRRGGGKRSERGASTVEFALVVLPLFAILFLTMDVAWMLFGWACIQEGAREGVRYAVTVAGQPETSLDNATKTVVEGNSFGFAASGNISVDYYPATGYSSSGLPPNLDGVAGATSTGNVVKVTVSGVTIRSFGPIFRSISTLQISASATDILE